MDTMDTEPIEEYIHVLCDATYEKGHGLEFFSYDSGITKEKLLEEIIALSQSPNRVKNYDVYVHGGTYEEKVGTFEIKSNNSKQIKLVYDGKKLSDPLKDGVVRLGVNIIYSDDNSFKVRIIDEKPTTKGTCSLFGRGKLNGENDLFKNGTREVQIQCIRNLKKLL